MYNSFVLPYHGTEAVNETVQMSVPTFMIPFIELLVQQYMC